MHYPAKFFYDGTRMAQAKEDAAEEAMRVLNPPKPKSKDTPAAQYGNALAA